jgi:putative transposase
MVSLAERRRGAKYLQASHGSSERRACRVVGIARSSQRRPSGRTEEAALIQEVHRVSERYPRFGYRKIYDRVKWGGWRVSRERIRRIRCQEGLRISMKAPKRRRRGASTSSSSEAMHPNHVWSYDFVSDQTADGRTLRFLTVLDEYTRVGLWIECARSLTSDDVTRVLGQLIELYGVPAQIKSDNGPEFVAKQVQKWLHERGIGARFIEPGSPWQNGHNESFNGIFRDGCLNRWLFESVREAQEASEAWLVEYNEERPHGSLGGLTPSEYWKQWKIREAVPA